jgi:putative oxidoreductase
MNKQNDGVALAGRVFLSPLFLLAGFGKLTGFAGAAGYIASKGLPMPQVLAGLAVIAELGGGLALLFGFKTRLVAWLLVLFLIIITPIFHNFWAAAADQVQNQQNHFMKNLAILGGMLMVAAFGPGRFSIDRG